MDNLPAQKTAGVRDAIERRRNAHVPAADHLDFTPIEEILSKFSAMLRARAEKKTDALFGSVRALIPASHPQNAQILKGCTK